MEDVEQRMKLDLIAQKKDSNFLDHLLIVKQLEEEGTPPHPFQKVGVEFIDTAGARCILGDQTGLGKTWQAVLWAETQRLRNPEFQTVVICKASNKPNWAREIKRLAGVDAIVCEGGKPDFFDHIKPIMARHPYIIINYETLATRQETRALDSDGQPAWHDVWNKEAGEYESEPLMEEVYTWAGIFLAAQPNFVVADEAHYIKSPEAHRSKAVRLLAGVPHVLVMTASPILNRTEELWPLLYMMDPVMFRKERDFLDKYTWNGRQPKNVKELHALLKPRFLRRLKKDVQPDLPPINRITRWMELSPGAKKQYEDVLAGVWELVATFDPQGHGGGYTQVMSILAQITRLKQVCAADKMDYTAELATEIQDSNENGGKVLIFSHFMATAAGIAQRLGGEAVCTVKRTPTDFVSMSPAERDTLFEKVRNDPSIKYVVTTSASQEGHNMEFCDWVIFNDQFWTPEAHNQCEGRAYGRLSNPHPIDSYYVVADVDIERWIMELLGKKLAIIQTAVEGVETARDTDVSIGMELIKRMKEEMWRRKR
jgi:SNF2 family DNA or RNA helicase